MFDLEAPMPLTAGDRLHSYEILAAIGAGGMGHVYRAHDTKLNRDVALKVLPPEFTHDPERVARFRREAQVLAALNHPNIAQIYGFEERSTPACLILELVEGPTLSDLIAGTASGRGLRASGPGLPIAEALAIARQIAEGLEAAHEQGIIHRDLKPANVKVRADGMVKVLDFGLAKAFAPATAGTSAEQVNSPTLSMQATQAGVILGTAAYMSPEQASGRGVDKRSDLWAFGVVLMETLTGRPVFTGETISHGLASVLRSEPDWTALPADTPPEIRKLLRRCLEKDRKRRFADASDARLEILDALPPSSRDEQAVSVNVAPKPVWRRAMPWLAAVLLSGFTGTAVWVSRGSEAETRAYWTTIVPPAGVTIRDTTGNVPARRLALSPDGRWLAFTASGGDGKVQLWVRSLAGVAAQPLAGTDGATFPFWSPDSDFLGFFAEGQGNATLKKINLSGSPPTLLCEMPGLSGSGGTWNRDGVILFGSIQGGPLRRVSASGGPCSAVTTLDAQTERSHINPFFLPDGRHFLYLATGRAEAEGGLSAAGCTLEHSIRASGSCW